jgi:hypothetical protein
MQSESLADVITHTLCMAVESDVRVASRIGGIHGVLAYLNARTRYRFTGIYPAPSPVDGSPLCRAYLYDRETPSLGSEPDCFPALPCLDAHLIGADGAVRGRLYHVDHRLRTAAPSEASLLQFLASRADRWLDA